jgi:hypothetical protein
MPLVKGNKFNGSSIFWSYLNSSIVQLRKQMHNTEKDKEHCSRKRHWTIKPGLWSPKMTGFTRFMTLLKKFQAELIKPNFLLYRFLILHSCYYFNLILFCFYKKLFTSVQSMPVLNLQHKTLKFLSIPTFVIADLHTTHHMRFLGMSIISATNSTCLSPTVHPHLVKIQQP